MDSHFAVQAGQFEDALERPVRRDNQPQFYAGGVGLVPGLPELVYAAGIAKGGTGHVDDTLAVVVAPGSVLRTAARLMGIPVHDTVDQAGASLRPPR